MAVLEGAALVQWVNASCVAQGLPLAVSDAGAVAKVCTLLQGGTPGPERRERRRDSAAAWSDAPVKADPGGIECASAEDTRCDHGVVQHDTDNR